MTDRNYHVVLFGATGFTGSLVAEFLHQQYGEELKWAIAGRNQDKLQQLSAKCGAVPWIVADVSDQNSLNALAAQTKVVCSTVGPYSLYGSPVVAACIDQGTHYCDLTGEVPWIRQMIDRHHSAAQDKGIKIVHCCGFDSIPSDMGVFFLQQAVNQETGAYCNRISMRVKGTRGGLSGGTYASMKEVAAAAAQDSNVAKLLFNPYGLNPDVRFQGPDVPDQMGAGYDDHYKAYTAPFIMASINTRIVRRTHALTGFKYGLDFQYDEAMLTGRGWTAKLKAKILSSVIRQMSSPKKSVFKSMVDKIMPKSGDGPSAQQREQGFFSLGMLGVTPAGQTFRASIKGDRDPGYGSTAKMLGESAVCLALDDLPEVYGVITPALAMGNSILTRLQQNSGLSFTLESTA